MDEVTLLSYEQVDGESKSNIFKKIDCRATITDFAILLGGIKSNAGYDMNFKNRTGYYWIKSTFLSNVINKDGYDRYNYTNSS